MVVMVVMINAHRHDGLVIMVVMIMIHGMISNVVMSMLNMDVCRRNVLLHPKLEMGLVNLRL